MLTTASPKPSNCSSRGKPAVSAVKMTGMAVARTADTGATMPIRPVAKPRKRNPSPTIPESPASAPHIRSASGGSFSRRANATITSASNPTVYEISTVWNGPTRRAASPPVKSPDPQAVAADSANTVARNGEPIEIRCWRVQLGRYCQS
jgi:hypothetical protein